MAVQYQVNISISAGTEFTQEYSVTDPNLNRVNITGFKFYANLAKHPTAIDAAASTSGSPVYKYVPFATNVENGVEGVYSITLSGEQTSKLTEGKYVYNIIMEDLNSAKTSVVSGLAFVEVAFGAVSTK